MTLKNAVKSALASFAIVKIKETSMRRSLFLAAFSCITLLSVSAQAEPEKKCSELSMEQKANIGAGKMERSEWIPDGSKFKQIAVYMKVEGTAKEAMALFSNFESHKDIFPLIQKATVTNRSEKLSWDVEYKIGFKAGPLSNVGLPINIQNSLWTNSKQSAFRMDWKRQRAGMPMGKEIDGLMTFELVNGFVCMTYSDRLSLMTEGDSDGLSVDQKFELTQRYARSFARTLEKFNSNPKERVELGKLVGKLESKLNPKQTVAAVLPPDQVAPGARVRSAAAAAK